uniref:G_PROTEIN_RECEP_F1_2 domain-containing protein n=1 Tax=Heterorhabditis bacteriophora TaxID=37862 RepID=A0A1I7WAH0_HETBA
MDNSALFDSHNDALLLFYNINGPICIILNLLAIYLIVFKSSREMGEYRWYLLHYQFKALVPLQIFRSLNKRIITFPNLVILSTDLAFCYRYIYQRFIPTYSVCSHSCHSRSWIPHHQNGILNFHKKYKVSHKKFIFCIVLLLLVVSSFHYIAIQLSHIHPCFEVVHISSLLFSNLPLS